MQVKTVTTPSPVLPLEKALSKCNSEDDVPEEEQPIHIDEGSNVIRCRWCPNFKGSTEPRVVNQHMKYSKTHQLERQHRLHPEDLSDPTEGVQDIRSYFEPH